MTTETNDDALLVATEKLCRAAFDKQVCPVLTVEYFEFGDQASMCVEFHGDDMDRDRTLQQLIDGLQEFMHTQQQH